MIWESGLISLLIQFVTGVADVYGLTFPITPTTQTLHSLLRMELFVQVLEFIFYIWLIFHLHSQKNITIFRYYDWAFTTPLMLFTFIGLTKIRPDSQQPSLWELFQTEKSVILYVWFLNALMLGFGYLSELYPSQQILYVGLGTIPFLMYFYTLYNEYVKEKETVPSFTSRQGLFWYFFITWSLYGIAALFPYVQKNIAYNMLDILSKNFFGIFLVILLYQWTYTKDHNPTTDAQNKEIYGFTSGR